MSMFSQRLSGWATSALKVVALSALTLSSISLSTGCSLDAAEETGDVEVTGKVQEKVVYGDDDRGDVFDHSDANLRRLAELSTVSLVDKGNMGFANPNNIVITGNPLKSARPDGVNPICTTPAPKFADDKAAAYCSGTLIDDDLVLTAGHCLETPSPTPPCGANGAGKARFVFNYRNDAPGVVHNITSADVFSCVEAKVLRNDAIATGNFGNDYAIVRLDRKATPRFTPAAVRTSVAPLAGGQKVAAIGSPVGIPHKIESGGNVTDPGTSTTAFRATLDVFGGSSGSAVYELDGYQVTGVLTRAANFMPGPAGSQPPGCLVPVSCAADGTCPADPTAVGGAIVSHLNVALTDFCAKNPSNARLCGSRRNTFAFSAVNTNSASENTINHFVYLEPGATIDATTCSTLNPQASGVGDTLLNVVSPQDPFLRTEVVSMNDDDPTCGVLSRVTFTVPAMRGGLYQLQAGCFNAGACSGTVAYTVTGPSGGSLSYDATNTNSGLQNTRDLNISVLKDDIIVAGTCSPTAALGTTEALPAPITMERPAFIGDTFLSLVSGAVIVASNDDACGGRGSQLKFKATATGTLKLRAGCFSNTSCSGTVAYTLNRQTAFYARSNTNNATVNTLNTDVVVRAGDQITVGTCALNGSASTGDTFLRLFSGANALPASNNGCANGLGSLLTHRATAAATLQVRGGCSANSACFATPVIRVTRASQVQGGSGSFAYAGAATNNATRDTAKHFLYLRAGQQVKVSTCNLGTAGDTFLRVFGPNSRQVASNDDDSTCALGATASTLSFSVGAGQEGAYEIRGGCFGDTICQATTTFQSL